MKTPILLFAFLSLSGKFLSGQNASNRMEVGKTIFINNCASCHLLNRPPVPGMQPLQHIRELRGKDYVYNFIWNSFKLIGEKNKTALKVYKDAGCTPMNMFPSLTKNDIDAICDYIDTQLILKK